MRKALNLIAILLVSIAVDACSGGGSGSTGNNQPPITNPDPQQELPKFSSIPAPNSTNVELNPFIELSFEEAIDSATINSDNVILSATSETENLKWPLSLVSVSDDQKHFVLKADQALLPYLYYHLTVTDSVKTVTGNSVAGQISFTSGGEETLKVYLSNPRPNQEQVSRLPIINLQFSQDVINVDDNSVSLHKGSVDGEKVAINFENINATSYNITPQAELEKQTTYFVVIKETVTNRDKLALKASSFQFTTGDAVAPEATLISPQQKQKAAPDSEIIIKFNEKVTNVNSNTLHLIKSNVELPIEIQALDADTSSEGETTDASVHGTTYQISLKDKAELDKNSTYTLVLSDQIQNEAGQYLKQTKFLINTLKDTWSPVVLPPQSTGTLPQLQISDDNLIYIAYADNATSKAIVKRFNGNSWSTVGTTDFAAVSRGLSLTINSITQQPALALSDANNNDSISTWLFDGEKWSETGSKITPDNAAEPSFIYDKTGTPWLSFSNPLAAGDKTAKVYQYASEQWAAISEELKINKPRLVSSASDGSIYLAYYDDSQEGSEHVTIRTYKDNQWSNPASSELPNATQDIFDIKVAPDGTLYAAYVDKDNTLTVQRVDTNGAWETVGDAINIKNSISQLKLAIDKKGKPYVAVISGLDDVSVLSLTNATWQTVGEKVINNYKFSQFDFAIDNYNIPYLIFGTYNGQLIIVRLN